jgi:hypothetical protein
MPLRHCEYFCSLAKSQGRRAPNFMPYKSAIKIFLCPSQEHKTARKRTIFRLARIQTRMHKTMGCTGGRFRPVGVLTGSRSLSHNSLKSSFGPISAGNTSIATTLAAQFPRNERKIPIAPSASSNTTHNTGDFHMDITLAAWGTQHAPFLPSDGGGVPVAVDRCRRRNGVDGGGFARAEGREFESVPARGWKMRCDLLMGPRLALEGV